MSNIIKYKIKGDFHFHSLHSGCQGKHKVEELIDYKKACGVNSIQEMVKISRLFKKLGYDYLAITNHSSDPVGAKPANAREIKLLLDHIKEVKKLNKGGKCAVEILSGAEVNILNQEGRLSVSDGVLKKLDAVIASNHRLTDKLSAENIKGGFMGAIKNKEVDIIGHVNRFIKKLKLSDWEEIILAAKKHNKIMEFNLRAPFSKDILKLVADNGLLVSIGSDTHPEVIIEEHQSSAEDYVEAYYKKSQQAVEKLIKGGVKPDKIINTYSSRKIKKFIKFIKL